MSRISKVAFAISVATVAVTAACLSGCNTVEGAGRDLQAVGKGTSDAARGVGDALTGKR